MTWEDYRVYRFRENINVAKAQLELKLVNNMGDNKKDFLKYISNKRRTRENIDLLPDENGLLSGDQ